MLDNPITVSDELPDDFGSYWIYIDKDGNVDFENTKSNTSHGWFKKLHDKECYKTVIAGLENQPTINWNGLESEFGFFDVKNIAKVAYEKRFDQVYFLNILSTFQIINDKKYSLEDIKKAFNAGCSYTIGSHENFKQIYPDLKEYIKMASQPKIFDIEIERELLLQAYGHGDYSQPKITNNSIKIIKKL